jgi:GTP cyclohydrolase IA
VRVWYVSGWKRLAATVSNTPANEMVMNMTDSPKKIEELKLSDELQDDKGESIADLVRVMLARIGEDPTREGLRRTPERFERALRYLTSGYHQDPEKVLNGAMFSVSYDQMVVVKDIDLFSLCEHHILPFFGKCHVAYLPDKRVVGLSKIPRLVNMFSRRLQIQERLTNQIALAIQKAIQPLGVGVVIEARHLCMVMRGVEKHRTETITSAMLGAFRENQQTREEFLSLIGRRSI